MTNSNQQHGYYVGVGVGPGDPELITLKAINAIKQCGLLVYPANVDNHSMARNIAKQHIPSTLAEHPIPLNFSTNRAIANAAYDVAAERISATLKQGKNVAILCLGDPLFYGSFIYLHQRLQNQFTAQVIPGITAANAAASLAQQPLTLQRDSYFVTPAPSTTKEEQRLHRALKEQDCIVIMKAGAKRQQIIEWIEQSGRSNETVYIEQAGLADQQICQDIRSLDTGPGNYFSVFIISKHAN